ncbi:GTP-binding protein RAD [Orchesella cincta]|uniref:GTP-binding protein RAD n=1 Tax=Orchesella cincta TaxID=48709 RepID=A0A1D2MJ71_ORCCI|nr:GTP-binding protein RAD [Orchesella cincta]
MPRLFPEGKQLATNHDSKFIETSSGIQHNVDELLVGVLKQIRLREAASIPQALPKAHNRSHSHVQGTTPRGSIMSLLFTRELINKLCFLTNKAKSCENLHVL